ncbi:hypothetical protein AVBRAN12642_02430 [Campylobacter sp. RM12642]|uniref:hypothetical protein n=1 Tax=Campylobacter sp. RM12642 TaxID=2735736 RepID=UPI003014BD98|nr:hypothetical protein [Campylobacter sp. RM12642]
MKKLLTTMLICSNLIAAKQELVKIEPAKVFYVNYEKEKCSDECLKDLLYKGLYISYITRFNSNDEKLNNIYVKLLNGIEYIDLPKKQQLNTIKIALVIPEKVVKSYSSNIISPALAYLMKQNDKVYMKVYFTGDESEANIAPIISQLHDYSLIITGFQKNGINVLNKSITNIAVFNPLAKSSDFDNVNSNFTFGSIDYQEQVAKLINISNNKIAVFKDDSLLASKITDNIREQSNIISLKTIEKKNLNVNSALSDAWKLNNSSVFFNIPLVKTTLLATQIRALSIRPNKYLSTQINYHPMFLNLSQENERSMFYFANSIGEIDEEIEYINDLLGQKIAYNWIAYSTSVGLDYYYHELYSNKKDRLFKDNFIGNSIHFNVRIMNAKQSKFSEQK